MGEVTREELTAMTDQELLAYEREHHGDPYMTLVKAKGMQRVALRFWHVEAARTKAGAATGAVRPEVSRPRPRLADSSSSGSFEGDWAALRKAASGLLP